MCYDDTKCNCDRNARVIVEGEMIIDVAKITNCVTRKVVEKILAEYKEELVRTITKYMREEAAKIMASALDMEVEEIDKFGQRTGKKTTIRNAMMINICHFLQVNVDSEGRETNYNGRPRAERYLGKILEDNYVKNFREDVEAKVEEISSRLICEMDDVINSKISKLDL